MTRPLRKHVATAGIAAIALVALAGCTGDPGGGGGGEAEDQEITFWTPHTSPERLAMQKEIADAFTEESGIKVDVVPMAGADQDQALVTGAASGNVPDVILHASPQTSAWAAQGLLDTEAAQATIGSLGEETFNQHALEALSVDGGYGAVPSDGWSHVIAYRSDMLEKAGVDVPSSLEELAEAATAVKEQLGITGMAFGTQAGTASATEGIQSLFQTAGCELVTDGEVTIDAPECAEAAELFLQLRDSSVSGDFDVSSARAAYLNGQAAMLLFSTHIFDEVVGLDDDNPVTCPECAADPAFLGENTDYITVLDPDNPRQYGAILAYGIPTGANADAAQQYIEYVMSTGYLDTLATASEGRIPLRNGTADNESEYLDGWGELTLGSEGEQTIAEVYGDEFVQQMGEGINAIYLWGMGTPDAELAGLAFSQGILAGQIEQLYAGASGEEVTAAMAQAVKDLQGSL